MRMWVVGVALVVALGMNAPATIIWGYETWQDTNPPDGQVDEWGRYNISFVPDNVTWFPESIAIATIQGGDVWGKAYYGSGVSSDAIRSQYKYLYVETYDIQGNMKLAISGGSDADFYDVTPHCIAGDPGHPNVIYNPGPYVFDMSGWSPASPHDNVYMQLIAEGGEGKGFSINRVFFTDDMKDTGFAVPEPGTALLTSLGLAVGVLVRKRRKA